MSEILQLPFLNGQTLNYKSWIEEPQGCLQYIIHSTLKAIPVESTNQKGQVAEDYYM